MASSRESSVDAAESASLSKFQLTPNSKVKAMLAALDKDDEDEELELPTTRRNLFKTKSDNTPKALSSQQDEGESDDEEEIVRPRGRMAARMLASKDASGSEKEAVSPASSKNRSPAPVSEDSEGSDTPVAPRNRKIIGGRRSTPQSHRLRSETPGLFVSPQKHKSTTNAHGSDSDNEFVIDTETDAFQALVARKRQERQEKEAKEATKKAQELAARKKQTAMFQDEDDKSDDDVAERRLTQSNPPTRKASKKAKESMARETQRLLRMNQLSHAPVVKKKFTIASFVNNFKQSASSNPSSSSPPPQPSLDDAPQDTPATSPSSDRSCSPKPLASIQETSHLDILAGEPAQGLSIPNDLSEHVVDISAIPSSPPTRADKGKEIPRANNSPKPAKAKKKYALNKQPVHDDGSDSDLEIIKETPSMGRRLDAVFDRAPGKQELQSRPLHVMKMLADAGSYGRQNFSKDKKPGMTIIEMQISLQQRAKQQAKLEREEKLQSLRDRGIIIQTAEEKLKEAAEVETLISKARREADEIGQREREAAKKERKANGESDPLGENSSDDEDWEEEKDTVLSGSDDEMGDSEEEEEEDNDASGEDDEEDDEVDLEGEALNSPKKESMFDIEADHADNDEDEIIAEDNIEDDEDEVDAPANRLQRRSRKSNVISDDEDDEESFMATPVPQQFKSPMPPQSKSPAAPTSVLRSATKTFIPGVTVAGVAGLGLTQIFAGTMDDSQLNDELDNAADSPVAPTPGAKNDSMAFLRRLLVPELPPFVPTPVEDTQDVIMDSQSAATQPGESQPETPVEPISLEFSQSQINDLGNLIESSQMSDFPEPTQDAGPVYMTPIRERFLQPPPSTVDTVVMDRSDAPRTQVDSPIVKKKGKLFRRAPQVASLSDDEDIEEPTRVIDEPESFEITANAFDAMRKKPLKKAAVDNFDKKKSDAKDMVQEQADESEDEYAGLGGASDDDSDGEADAYVKEMIDDQGGEKVDERQIAALFAERERIAHEKGVESLMNNMGKNRRRRGAADLDLSDSDDDEAQRSRKRAKFARQQKALLRDERLGKIAQNTKSQAFLASIQDHGSEDEMDFLEEFKDFNEMESQSQSQSQAADDSQQQIPASQPDTSMGPPKHKPGENATEGENRPPAALRRTKLDKKPLNQLEVRRSLSSLIDEPNAPFAPVQSDSDSDDELDIEGAPDDLGGARPEKGKENRDPFALRRTNVPVIDRISLKRASSSSLSANTRLAFSAASSSGSFKVPALLRRATTNSSITSDTGSMNSSIGGMSATERMAGAGNEGIKRGGGKNSGVNFQVREKERKAGVVKTQKRREMKLVKGAKARAKVVGGILGMGKFE